MLLSTLLTFIIVLAVIGFALWLVTSYVPMPEPFKRVLVVGACLILLLVVVRWLLTSGVLALP